MLSLYALKMVVNHKKRVGKSGRLGAKVVNSAVVVLIIVTVLFATYAAIIPEAQSAGDSFGDVDRCSGAGGFFNSSQDLCLNGTSPADTAQVPFNGTPLSALFSSTGVVFVVVMAGLLIILLRALLTKKTEGR